MKIITKPKIGVYQLFAFAECIAEAGHPDYREWFVMNFNQIVAFDYTKGHRVLSYLAGTVYGYHSLLDIVDYSKTLDRSKKSELYEVLTKGIENQKAWYLFIDHFYIPNYREYQREHLCHDILIFDFNKEENKFSFIEFVGSKYVVVELDWDTLYEAISSHNDICVYNLSAITDRKYEFNLEKFILMLEEYVYSKKPADMGLYWDFSVWHSDVFYDNGEKYIKYGIDIYKYLQELISICVEKQIDMDYRTIYLEMEHKKNLLEKIDYLMEKGYLTTEQCKEISDDLANIIKLIDKCLRVVIRFNCSKDPEEAPIIINYIEEVYTKEKDIFMRLISCLK